MQEIEAELSYPCIYCGSTNVRNVSMAHGIYYYCEDCGKMWKGGI